MKPVLYLQAFEDQNKQDDTSIFVPLDTLIVLNVLAFVENSAKTTTFLIVSEDTPTESCVRISKDMINAEFHTNVSFATNIASKMTFPVIKVDDLVYVGGLCGVCRSIIKNAGKTYEYLLGFKQSCLSAPAEVSPWTKFCEIDVIQCTQEILAFHKDLNKIQKQYMVPNVISCFESHLSRPPRQHNKGKTKPTTNTISHIENQMEAISLESARGRLDENMVPKQFGAKELFPQFMEGDRISIADIVVFPCFSIIISTIANHSRNSIEKWLPLTHTWIERVKSNYKNIAILNASTVNQSRCDVKIDYILQSVEDFSLYKREPKGQRAKARKFTKQHELDQAIHKINEMGIDTVALHNSPNKGDVSHSLMWSDIPSNVLPECEQIPETRLDRKRDQLLCLAKEVAELSSPGNIIVDFCSGAGHLGILIAHQLPECFVILLENKEESVQRAKERVQSIGLRNIAIFQCNIDYLSGDFDLGTSLHACGVATDIVMLQSIKRQAKFVCCPCCYGGCVQTPDISYPRSKWYRSYDLTSNDYKYLSHAADQAHDLSKTQNPEKSLQGVACMDYVDTDRKLYAEECGYIVKLTKLHPEDCTPKNRLLIGTYDNRAI